ncbi:MAG: ArsR/SmtB family transcription factor [Alphaproteobacteria bacterium]
MRATTDGCPKRAVLSGLAAIAKALGNAHRLDLLEQLAQGERSVDALSARTGLSFANTSQHLRHLRQAGLVISRQQGKQVFYGLSDDRSVVALLAALRAMGESGSPALRGVLAESLYTLDDVEPVTRADLLARVADGSVTVIDVRPGDEFTAGHLPGALSIPLADLERRLSDLPPDREVVAYCRGPYCVLSFRAVSVLRTLGFTARRLEDGYPEWRTAGLPVERPA